MHAATVSELVAKAKAVEIMKSRFSGFSHQSATVTPVRYQGELVYYVVQFAPQGWTLISADDRTEPLIGFSDEGQYVINDVPEQIMSVINCFSRRIIDRARHTQFKAAGWETGASTYVQTRASKADIPYLIQVNWNQGKPYNAYCPQDGDKRTLVGCVAVGMAQAMSVAQWPLYATGTYSYTSPKYGQQTINYDEEPAYNWSNILSGANNKDDVARLLRHCGVAVNMDYGLDGSGTQSSYIAKALQRNFGYPASVEHYSRKDFSESDWDDLIYTELAEGRAIAFHGYDPVGNYGHCFNLDGYVNGAYHVNWGWGGSNNGYFELHALKDNTMGMDYSSVAYQGAVIGIRRPLERPSDIKLSNTTVEAGKPEGTEVAKVTVVNESTVPPVYTWTLSGGRGLGGKPIASSFDIVDGNRLVTKKELTVGNKQVIIKVTDQNDNSVERTFNIKVTDPTGIDGVVAEKTVTSTEVYTIEGKRQQSVRNGINVVRYNYSDGTKAVKKINKK